ncbi:unnamed protein product [Phytophthora fragariaefolia]|uniref:Unnamed protein product n=1 Tax=Phytophthora fragariaefolia TaxID=1490495 RepID=A0A9W6Y6A7_9STRA|nr:unnamed protein product [Phytophthora fragariaefolia]
MERFVETIAAGSTLMRLADGSTKIVMDNNILPVLQDIADRNDIKLSAQDEIKIGNALAVSLGDIIDRLAGINKFQDAATDAIDHDSESTDSAPSESIEHQDISTDLEEEAERKPMSY